MYVSMYASMSVCIYNLHVFYLPFTLHMRFLEATQIGRYGDWSNHFAADLPRRSISPSPGFDHSLFDFWALDFSAHYRSGMPMTSVPQCRHARDQMVHLRHVGGRWR